MRLYSRQSSANNLRMVDDMQSGRSLMQIKNSRRPMTVPGGTSDVTSDVLEESPPTIT